MKHYTVIERFEDDGGTAMVATIINVEEDSFGLVIFKDRLTKALMSYLDILLLDLPDDFPDMHDGDSDWNFTITYKEEDWLNEEDDEQEMITLTRDFEIIETYLY